MPVEHEFAVMSPVIRWSLGSVNLPGGVEIVRLPQDERPDLSADPHITEDQKQTLNACEYWLVRDLPTEQTLGSRPSRAVEDAAKDDLLNTQIAFQVILPRDSELIFLTMWKSKRLDLRSWVYRSLVPPRWPRMLWPSSISESEVTRTVEGVQKAFSTTSVRLKNPFYFLELGLQADNPGVRSFLWTTGIDALLAANSESKFVRRISNLLGARSYVFPADGIGRQPIYTVEQLAPRIYKLRSLVAHGVEIDSSFRRKVAFQAIGGLFPLTGEFLNYLEADVLNEAALFLLCAALRRVVANHLLFDLFSVQDDWIRALDTAAFPA